MCHDKSLADQLSSIAPIIAANESNLAAATPAKKPPVRKAATATDAKVKKVKAVPVDTSDPTVVNAVVQAAKQIVRDRKRPSAAAPKHNMRRIGNVLYHMPVGCLMRTSPTGSSYCRKIVKVGDTKIRIDVYGEIGSIRPNCATYVEGPAQARETGDADVPIAIVIQASSKPLMNVAELSFGTACPEGDDRSISWLRVVRDVDAFVLLTEQNFQEQGKIAA